MNIEVKEMQSQVAVAVKQENATMAEISTLATEGLQKVFGFLSQQGVEIAGAPYLAYKNGNADFSQFDVELGIPVAGEVPVQGEFFMTKTCEGKAATVMYKGAYKDIEPAYMALMEYMTANSLESTGVYYDYYISNPADTPESELLTEVVFPIK
ncbi:MAG: GyrI-like domain-containing protein [Oscillospiraceae bacterium]|jgi:effector-binding domain-containing protein|nr:GyrI-like domain-containing protein [Oscillospiraceae bacterium]